VYDPTATQTSEQFLELLEIPPGLPNNIAPEAAEQMLGRKLSNVEYSMLTTKAT